MRRRPVSPKFPPHPVALRSPCHPRPLHGFTLIELLVTLAIIGILLSLLTAGITGARFRSRVTVCSNNFRQWGIAATLYAQDDQNSRLPSFALPLDQFAQKRYADLAPWFVSLDMGPNLAKHGVTLPLWFCPAKRGGNSRALYQATFESQHPGQTLSSVNDLVEAWKGQSRFFAALDYNWWVPRPLTGSDQVYPDPALVKSRIPSGWPTRLEDPAGAVQPILTDWAVSSWNETKTSFGLSGTGGHEFPSYGPTRSINALFVDGHVETRNRSQIQWQMEHGSSAFSSLIVY